MEQILANGHGRRLQGRERGLPHIPEPTWDQIVLRDSVYEPWTDACPVVDTKAALESVVDAAHHCLGDDLQGPAALRSRAWRT